MFCVFCDRIGAQRNMLLSSSEESQCEFLDHEEVLISIDGAERILETSSTSPFSLSFQMDSDRV